jgi:cell division septal protein FtsQ
MARTRGSARRTLVAFLRVPKNRRRTRRDAGHAAAWLRLARRATPIAIGAALVMCAWPIVRARAIHHPYFAITAVVIHSRGHLDHETLRTLAGVPRGASIWEVDAKEVAARVAASPWVRAVTARRDLPSRVVIRVRQYRPAAIVALADPGGGLFYAVRPGRLVARVSADDPTDLPYVTGLADPTLASGGTNVALARALRLLRVARRATPEIGAVSEIHVDTQRGLTLLPTRPQVPIVIGWSGFERKVGRARQVLARWKGREREIAQLSCVFRDQVIVRARVVANPPRGGKTPART